MRYRPLAYGADPEYLVFRNGKLISMAKVLGKAQLDTHIGTDGLESTGEFRPPPARNVYALLHELAVGLGRLSRAGLTVYAAPAFGKEYPLGGHLHASFRMEDQTLITTTIPWGEGMDLMVVPMERRFQPPDLLQVRHNHNYGLSANNVREEILDAHCIKLEYRRPSTWLVHPALAYCYLAMGKLVATRLTYIMEWYTQLQYLDFDERFGRIFREGYVHPDLRQLPAGLAYCAKRQSEWWKDGFVCADAWAKVEKGGEPV